MPLLIEEKEIMRKLVVENDILFSNVIELLSRGKQVKIPVKGSSMLPFIVGERDLVLLENVPHDNSDSELPILKVGDIVLFRFNSRFILHRIIEINGNDYIIQGDGVVNAKEKCSLSDIFGRVVTIYRRGEKEIDPYSRYMMFLLGVWNFLGPLRRYLLAIYRRLPF